MNREISPRILYMILAVVAWFLFVLSLWFAISNYFAAQPNGDPASPNGIMIIFSGIGYIAVAITGALGALFTYFAFRKKKV